MSAIRAGSCPSLLAGLGGRDRSAKAALAEDAHDVPLVFRGAAVVGLRLRRLGRERRSLPDDVVRRLVAAEQVLGGGRAEVRRADPVKPIPAWPTCPFASETWTPTAAVAKSPTFRSSFR